MTKVKILSKKPIFQASLFTVREIEFQINKKKFIQHDIVRKPVVTIFPLTEKNEIYLIEQYRRLLEKNTLEAVAGFINDGESPLEAAKRELKEETGLIAKEWKKLKVVNTAASVTKGRAHLFLAKGITEGEPQPEEDEEIKVIKMPFIKAVEKAVEGEIDIATTIAGILLIDKLQSQKKI